MNKCTELILNNRWFNEKTFCILTCQQIPDNIDPEGYLHASKADLAHIADSILFSVDLSADPSPAAPGLDNRVGWRGGNLIIMWVWLAVRFLSCHYLLAFFLQKGAHTRSLELKTKRKCFHQIIYRICCMCGSLYLFFYLTKSCMKWADFFQHQASWGLNHIAKKRMPHFCATFPG